MNFDLIPDIILSIVAIASNPITMEFDVWLHQAGTNDVNHTRLEMNVSSPVISPQRECDLKQVIMISTIVLRNLYNTHKELNWVGQNVFKIIIWVGC